MRMFLCVTFALVVSAACRQAPVGVKATAIPSTSAQTCASQCEQVGLSLDSLVIMAGRIGCVCRAAAAPVEPTAGGPAAALASIILADEAAATATTRPNASSTKR